MLNAVRHKIAFRILDRFFKQKRHRNIVDFRGGVSRASKFLVHLPESYSEEQLALIEKSVKSAFPESSVCFLVVKKRNQRPKGMPEQAIESTDFSFLKIDTQKVNFIFAPDREFIRTLLSQRFDIALDLEKDFSLVSAYALNASGAYLVVGPLNTKYENFYNLQIKPREGQDLHEVFLENLRQLKQTSEF